MKLKFTIGKVLFFTFHFSLFTSAVLTSCSNIADDERLIYVEPTEAARNVLIEDFTGQNCPNCPAGADAIHEMEETYGNNIIAVAIHCGPFGGITPRNPGLMTDTGKEYWNTWFTNGEGQPSAKINRLYTNTDLPDNWIKNVIKCLEQTTDVSINANVKYNKETNTGSIDVVTSATVGRRAKIQVWLTEDNIIAQQKLKDNSIQKDYIHNHVFRSAVNGTWGEDIVYGESETKYTCEFEIDSKWVPENMHAVVFVYDDNGVEQVVQVPIIDPIETEVK